MDSSVSDVAVDSPAADRVGSDPVEADAPTDVLDALDAVPDAAVADAQEASADAQDAGCVVCVPRPVAPLSGATVTAVRPTLHWSNAAGASGAHLQVCSDRACNGVEADFDASGTAAAVPMALSAGVHFWRLAAQGTATTWSATWEFFVPHGTGAGDTSWGNVPDFNGDGLGDLVVDDDRAIAGISPQYLYLGRATGLPAAPDDTLLPTESAETEYGLTRAAIGDVNGDGFGDVAVSGCVPGASSPAVVHVYFGSASGPSQVPDVTLQPPGYCGLTLAAAGDVNADGYADFFVGGLISTQEFSSSVGFYFGGPSGPAPQPGLVLTGGSEWSSYGHFVGAADLNGDGFTDVAIEEVGGVAMVPMATRIYIHTGSAAGIGTSPAVTIWPPNNEQARFAAVSTIDSDANGDGLADLVTADQTGCGASDLYVFDGRAGALATSPDLTAPLPSGETYTFLFGAGDVDGNGIQDVIAGGTPIVGQSSQLRLFYGSSGSITFSNAPTFHVGAANGDSLTTASGRDIDGDGFSDLVIGSADMADSSGTTTNGGVFVVRGSSLGIDAAATQEILSPTPPDSGFGLFLALVRRIERWTSG